MGNAECREVAEASPFPWERESRNESWRTQQPMWALNEESLGAKMGRSNSIRKVLRYEKKTKT